MKEIKRVVINGRTAGFAIEGSEHVYPTKGSAERAVKDAPKDILWLDEAEGYPVIIEQEED